MPDSELMWWGYLHSNGTLQIKRWFGDHADYTTDCINNPFVMRVIKPFPAESREEAIQYLMEFFREELEAVRKG